MTHPADRDWLTPDNTAYVLSSTMQAGVGSYLTAVKVTIKSVGVRDVKVADSTGQVTRFRASSLTAPRTSGGWPSDDILVPVTDPRVGQARRAARAAELSDFVSSKIDKLAKGIATSKVKNYENPEAALAETLNALAAIRDAASDAHAHLTRIREIS